MVGHIARNFRIFWRAESIVADIQFKHLLKRSGLKAFAAVVSVFGLLMLNVTGFFAFEQLWGPVWAAGAVSVLDFCLVIVLLLISARLKPGGELDLAMSVRQAALDALESDAHSFYREATALRDDIYKIRSALAGIANHPLDGVLTGLIVPLAIVLLKNLKRSNAA